MHVTELAIEKIVEAFLYILLSFTSVFVLFIIFFYYSRKKIVKIEVEKRNLVIDHQKQLLDSIIDTQENERRRIAQDLHDEISSKLNVVSLHLQMLAYGGIEANETQEVAQNILNLTQKSLESSRRIAHDLLPPVFDKFGLHAAVEELVFEVASTNQVKIQFNDQIEKEVLKLQTNIQLHIFRIFQECINNTLKYAKAKNISISFEKSDGNLLFSYHDDGVGFDMKQGKYKKGIGLTNIESRVTLIHGNFTLESKVDDGFLLKFWLKNE